MASEKTQRALASDLACGIAGESVPFSFATKGRGRVMRQAAYAWVESLQKKIVDTLEYNRR